MLSRVLIQSSRFARTFATDVKPRVTQCLIDGKFVDSASGKTFDTFNPATEEKIASVACGEKEDIDRAVAAARRAFDEGPWRKMAPAERTRLMNKFADLLEQNADELAKLESLDNGKPYALAKAADIPLTIACYRYYAGWADKMQGKTIPIDNGYLCYTRHEPVGVCGQIIPWNFPALMQAWKWGPALATGCTIVLKPAEQTPLTALRIAELAMEAGFPNGVINVVPGYGPTAGQPLAEHIGVDKVAFTGSTDVGLQVHKAASTNRLKRVTLELGGKSPNIIFPDVDIDKAIAQSQLALFFNQGQCCIAGSRVFVEESIYDEFVEKATQAAQSRRLGDPLDSNTEQGPQVSEVQMNRILGYINSGKEDGAKMMCGGSRHGSKGYFVEPTVFADVKDDMKISREEIFGPVMSILKFSEKNMDDLIRRCNDNRYGLGAGVMTNDYTKALRVANGLRAGTVYINTYDTFNAALPFGGFKDSGVGRELGEYGLQNYTEVKSVVLATDPDSLP